MKRLIVLIALFAAVVSVQALSYLNVRPQGVNNPSDGHFYMICDSSDTFFVDTFYSDTIDIADYKYLHYKLQLTGYSLADSANDSVVIVVKGIGTVEGQYPITVLTDTIPTTLGTLDSAAVISGIVKIDSLPFSGLYFETVVQDSFVLGAGVDTSTIKLRYGVIQQVGFDR